MGKGKNIEEFGQLLGRNINKQVKVQTHWVRVSEVDWQQKKMNAIAVVDDLPFYNIQLGLGSLVRRPKQGTLALIGCIGNQETDVFLIDASEIEETLFTSADSSFTINESGFIIKQGQESLKEVLNDWQDQFGKLCDEINKIVVSVGVSPNIPAIKKIKNEVETKLKQRLNNVLIQ